MVSSIASENGIDTGARSGDRAPPSPRGGTRAWATVIILAALSTASFLDRQVLALLLPDLARDLHITDVQFGLLSGPAFIVVYIVTLLPAAVLVDRQRRSVLIAVGAVIWTVMTIASGFAHSFHQLVILRAGLAFGEALLGPATISLIGDLFERVDRPLPTAVYIAGSVVGSAGSTMISAAVLQAAGALAPVLAVAGLNSAWRLTMIGVGLPGLMLAIAFMIVVREPTRSVEAYAPVAGGEPLVAHLRRRGMLYAGCFVGYGAIGMVGTSVAFWGPTYLIRGFHLTQIKAGYLLGGVSLATGLAATLILPVIFRRMFRDGRVDQVVNLTLAGIMLMIIAAIVGSTTSALPLCLIGFGVVVFILMAIGTLPTLIIQLYAPSNLRGRISGGLFFLLYLMSVGVAPVLLPVFAHGIFSGPRALGHSTALMAMIFGTAGAILFATIRTPLRRAEAEIRAHAPAGIAA